MSAPEYVEKLDAVLQMLHAGGKRISWGDRLLTLDKNAAFSRNPAFIEAFSDFNGRIAYDEFNGQAGISWRLNTLCWSAKNALRIGGSLVECGVFKGDMAWTILHVLGPENIAEFLLYDSFDGFSPQYSSQADFPDNPGFFEFASNYYQQGGIYEDVCKRFEAFPQIRIVKGYLPDSLQDTVPDKIGFLHIDLNSPKAERAVLELLWQRVVPGGHVVFDDYGWHVFRKQKEMADEFMVRRGHEILELPTGQGLVIRLP